MLGLDDRNVPHGVVRRHISAEVLVRDSEQLAQIDRTLAWCLDGAIAQGLDGDRGLLVGDPLKRMLDARIQGLEPSCDTKSIYLGHVHLRVLSLIGQ